MADQGNIAQAAGFIFLHGDSLILLKL